MYPSGHSKKIGYADCTGEGHKIAKAEEAPAELKRRSLDMYN